MTRFVFALLAASALSPALAAEDPGLIKGSNDSRIRSVDYSTIVVTRLTSTNKVPIVITYGDAESPSLISGLMVVDVTIKDNLEPDAAAKASALAEAKCLDPAGPRWCVDRHSNQITLQPVKDDDGSMLTVTTKQTNAVGQDVYHHYSYELRTRAGRIADKMDDQGKIDPNASHDPLAYSEVHYTYSVEDRDRKQTEWRNNHKNDQADKQKADLNEKLIMAQFSGTRTSQWTGGDSEDCLKLGKPTRVSDNGQFTVLYFPPTVPVSIPNRVEDDGTETKISWHAAKAPDSGDFMILHEVPKKFVLRRGGKEGRDGLVCLFVRDPGAKVPIIPFTGTSSPDVVREVRK